MSQPKYSISNTNDLDSFGDVFAYITQDWAGEYNDIYISKAKTKKTAYKRAAAKLRNLADEAERLAEES